MDQPKRRRWLALLVLAGGVSGAAWLTLSKCWYDPSVPFLSERAPAEWILHADPWQLTAQAITKRRVRFRTTFELDEVPSTAMVRLRALREYCVWINEQDVVEDRDPLGDWKNVQTHDVVETLKPGQNEILVEVRHNRAPPALWLVLEAGDRLVKTDATWEARSKTTNWATARLATEPMDHPILESSPTVTEGWRRAWPMALVWLAIASLLTGLGWLIVGKSRPAETPAPAGRAYRPKPSLPELLLLGIVVGLWVVLCLNNVLRLPPIVGFDSPAHLDYISYLQVNEKLPLANEGWEMYQPPLYYGICAALVHLGHTFDYEDANTDLPKVVSMISGIGLIVLVWLALRELFPDALTARAVGLVLAGAMPMTLYIAQYPSNEMLSVAVTTAALVLTLRILRDARPTGKQYAALGVVLGLAMLTKHTAFILLVMVVATLVVRQLMTGARDVRGWLRGPAVVVALVAAVAGWQAYRNWHHFGNPLIGNWDPESGNAWWQDPGVGTADYYLRFGRCLTQPFHSSLYSYWDGIYSTVWGDGMCSGIANVAFRSPWHYDLMAMGFTMAWLPTALILFGLLVVLIRWLREPTATWGLVGGHGLLVFFAVFYMTIKLPYYAQGKGFYGLSAVAFLCAAGATGFETLTRRLGRASVLLWVPVIAWALNSYATYFVLPTDALTHYHLGRVFPYQNKPERGVYHLERSLELDASRVDAYEHLGVVHQRSGRFAEAREAWERGLERDPNHIDMLYNLTWLLATCVDPEIRDGHRALTYAQRACELTDYEDPFLLDALGVAYAELGQFDKAIEAARKAIELAQKQRHGHFANTMLLRLELYKLKRPYRDAMR